MPQDSDNHDPEPIGTGGNLDQAITALRSTMKALEPAEVPLASAYVDLALWLCIKEQEKRSSAAE